MYSLATANLYTLLCSGIALLCIVLATTIYQSYHDEQYPFDQGEWRFVDASDTIPKILPLNLKIPVTVTIYHPVPEQTDATPDILASGKKIKIRTAGLYRYIAVSRDLLSRWGGPLSYGDIVYIKNAGELSGYYIVEDTMNARWTNRVDILRSPGAPLAKFEEATLVMEMP